MIYINQDNPEERCKQVPIMHNIFRGATLVVAWLGLETESSRELFQSARDVKCRREILPERSKIDLTDDKVLQPRQCLPLYLGANTGRKSGSFRSCT